MQCLPLPPASFERTMNDLWNLHGVGLVAAEPMPHVYAFFHQPDDDTRVEWLVTVNALTPYRTCLLLEPDEALTAGPDGDATWAVIHLCEGALPVEACVACPQPGLFDPPVGTAARDTGVAWLN